MTAHLKQKCHFFYVEILCKFFQSISEAQDEAKYKEQEDNKYSHESKESDENSEIKNILSSVEKAIEKPPDNRMSKYIVEDEKASTQQEHMDQDWKIPVLETSESEFEESEYSKAGLSNMGFDKKCRLRKNPAVKLIS